MLENMSLPRRISKKSAAGAMNLRKTVAVAVLYEKICRWRGEFLRNCAYRSFFPETSGCRDEF
jgi:hypothetical protein